MASQTAEFCILIDISSSFIVWHIVSWHKISCVSSIEPLSYARVSASWKFVLSDDLGADLGLKNKGNIIKSQDERIL